MKTCPSVGSKNLRANHTNVLLPAPLEPTTATVSPDPTLKQTSNTALVSRVGYLNVTLRNSNVGRIEICSSWPSVTFSTIGFESSKSKTAIADDIPSIPL